MLKITRERLKEIVVRAYESGWSGCPELKEEYAELVLEGMRDSEDPSGTSSMTISSNPVSISVAGTNDLVSQHYSYYGYSVPGGTLLVDDPEDEL